MAPADAWHTGPAPLPLLVVCGRRWEGAARRCAGERGDPSRRATSSASSRDPAAFSSRRRRAGPSAEQGRASRIRSPRCGTGSVHGNGEAIIVAGMLLLILTPVAGLVTSAVAFARRRDWLFGAHLGECALGDPGVVPARVAVRVTRSELARLRAVRMAVTVDRVTRLERPDAALGSACRRAPPPLGAGEFDERFPTEAELVADLRRQPGDGTRGHPPPAGRRSARRTPRQRDLRRAPPARRPDPRHRGLAQAITAAGLIETSKVLRVEEGPAGDAVARALGTDSHETVQWVERLRYADGEPLALDLSALALDAAQRRAFAGGDLAQGSLYGLLETRCGLRITGGQRVAARRHLQPGRAQAAAARARRGRLRGRARRLRRRPPGRVATQPGSWQGLRAQRDLGHVAGSKRP